MQLLHLMQMVKLSVQNLTVGKYKYKEIDTPYYMFYEKQMKIEITSDV